MTMLSTRPGTRPGTLLIAGLALLLSGVLAVVLIFKAFNGDFGDHIQVSAEVTQVGDSLDRDDIVTYRDVIIGKVTSFEAAGDGGARLSLRIEGDHAGEVPASVTAIAVPASLFGNTKIVLVPPRDPRAGATLHDGSVVAADTSPSASGLQTALSDLYTLLTAVRPSELNAALTALAGALQGRGDDIGRLLDRTAEFLRTVSPAIPDIQRSITSFADATEVLARNAPDLIASLSNALTPAAAIVRRQAALRELLDIGPAAADRARRLVEDIGDDTVTVVTDQLPVLQALAARPNAVGATVVGFRNVGQALNSAFKNGRAAVNVLTTGVATSDLVPVLLGQPTNVTDAVANPREYTAADCPRYEGASGPNCTSTRAAVITSGRGPAANDRMVRQLVSAMSGVPVSRVPGAVTVLLGPVLRGGQAAR